MLDTRRGLYSYAALQGRLAENTYAVEGLVDYSGPVLRLANLTPEDFYVLLGNLRHVYAGGDSAAYLLPDEALAQYMNHCASRIGEAYFRTPRNTIKGFLDLLAVLEQNPGHDWRALIGAVNIADDIDPDLAPLDDESGNEQFLPREPASTTPANTWPDAGSSAMAESRKTTFDDDELASFRL